MTWYSIRYLYFRSFWKYVLLFLEVSVNDLNFEIVLENFPVVRGVKFSYSPDLNSEIVKENFPVVRNVKFSSSDSTDMFVQPSENDPR